MITAFVFAFVTSFWGSVPPGPSNLAVLHTVLNRNTKSGFWLGLGACLPEIPYTLLAVLAVQYVSAFQKINQYFEIGTAVLLLGIGIYSTFFQKEKKLDIDSSSRIEKVGIHPFLKGFVIGSMNPMIFGFWLITAEVATKTGSFDPSLLPDKICFVLGAALGALALLFLVALFTRKIKQKLTSSITNILNKGIGITFILLGVIQAFKFYVHNF